MGATVGAKVGAIVGSWEGDTVGICVGGSVGTCDCSSEGFKLGRPDGLMVGVKDGEQVGAIAILDQAEGFRGGTLDGSAVGVCDGETVEKTVGELVASTVGFSEGLADGGFVALGFFEGATEVLEMHLPLGQQWGNSMALDPPHSTAAGA